MPLLSSKLFFRFFQINSFTFAEKCAVRKSSLYSLPISLQPLTFHTKSFPSINILILINLELGDR